LISAGSSKMWTKSAPERGPRVDYLTCNTLIKWEKFYGSRHVTRAILHRMENSQNPGKIKPQRPMRGALGFGAGPRPQALPSSTRLHIDEAAAVPCETFEGFARRKARVFSAEALHCGQNRFSADHVSVKHRPALVGRPAISIEPDDIDVGGALRLSLFEDPEAFIDHRVNAGGDDFAGSGRRAGGNAGDLRDDPCGDFGRDRAAAFIIVVIAGPCFLAAAIQLAEGVPDRVGGLCALLPADIQTVPSGSQTG